MCLIVFSFKNHQKYPLIIAANRDEFYDRPTRPARFWDEETQLLAGKDEKLGGTWLGVTKQGKIAALTNYRDFSNIKEDAPSRGKITIEYLTGDKKALDYLKELHKSSNTYNGFNLINGNHDALYHYSNQTEKITPIKPGIHGVSNAVLNTPWPKVETAKSAFKEAIDRDDIDEKKIFALLRNSKQYPLNQLPNTGLSDEMEKLVSSAFIKSEDYGTRCSTLITVRNDGEITFIEKTYKPSAGALTSETRFSFTIEA